VRPQTVVLPHSAGNSRTRILHRQRILRLAENFHVPVFDRFDKILYLVEWASDLSLPDSVRYYN
jgi:hypothetical protein